MMTSIAPGRTALRDLATPVARNVTWTADWFFAIFALTSWIYAPFLRRFFDWRSGGFHAIDILSVLPLLAILPLGGFAFRNNARERVSRPFKILFGLWTAVLVYGLGIAAISGNLSGGLYEFAEYELPAIFGYWIAGQTLESKAALRRFVPFLLVLATASALYGIAQWISPSPWDVDWIEQSGLVSMGQPDPFKLRIFATLNSTGPAADFFAMTILFALPRLRLRNPIAILAIPALGAALLLTLVRAAWIGTILGLIVYLVTSPKRLRVIPYVLGGAFFIVFLATSLPTLLGSNYNADAITNRFETLGDTEYDTSAEARRDEYSESFDSAAGLPFGVGLGAFGPAARLSGASDVDTLGRVLDGGYIARLLSLGWIGFALYVCVTIGAPVVLFISGIRDGRSLGIERGSIVALGISVGAYLIWNDVAVDSHLGASGLMFWIATGLAFRALRDSKIAPE